MQQLRLQGLGVALGFVIGAALVLTIQGLYPPPPLPHMPQVFLVSDQATIAAALTKAQSGDTVEIPPGTFRELVDLKNGVNLVAQKAHESILEGSLLANRISGSRIEGIKIDAGNIGPGRFGIDVQDSDIQIARCEITGARDAGVRFKGSSHGSIIASNIHDNPGAGIAIEDSSNPAVENDIVFSNGVLRPLRPGLWITSIGHPAVTGNLFLKNGADAIWLPAPDENIESRNYFSVTGQHDAKRDVRVVGNANVP